MPHGSSKALLPASFCAALTFGRTFDRGSRCPARCSASTTLFAARPSVGHSGEPIPGVRKNAEKSTAEALLEQMSVYFEQVSRAISDEKGTVDKFIGDGIMAFWGAPATF